MAVAVKHIRERIRDLMNEGLNSPLPENIKEIFKEWLAGMDDGEKSRIASDKLFEALKKHNYSGNRILSEIVEKKDFLVKKSQWIIGGDGWAYDIGYGGVDHVLASGDDVNLFVMDTEVYSNTGGQSSKSTPTAAVAKFAASGKKIRKKDLGMMAMSYGYVYVAQIAMGANMNQTIKAITEAEKYKGPSLIIAYAPCVNHGIKAGMGSSIAETKKAVDAGYWHMYRFNPSLSDEGKNPFILDSKEPTGSFREFINGEIRYSSLATTFPKIADELFASAERHAKERYVSYKRLAEQKYE
jgi:pyruvate-ferredoxin/flavodoxin oxidoreductase